MLLAIVGCGSCVAWASSLDGGSAPPMKLSEPSAYIYGDSGELALLKGSIAWVDGAGASAHALSSLRTGDRPKSA